MTRDLEIVLEQKPRELKPGWIIYEGSEAFKNRKDFRSGKTLKKLKVNDYILFEYKMDVYKKARIVSKNKYEASAKMCKSNLYLDLSFSQDDRKCWVVTGFVVMNTSGILRLELAD